MYENQPANGHMHDVRKGALQYIILNPKYHVALFSNYKNIDRDVGVSEIYIFMFPLRSYIP